MIELSIEKKKEKETLQLTRSKVRGALSGLRASFQPNSSNPCQVKNFKILEIFTI